MDLEKLKLRLKLQSSLEQDSYSEYQNGQPLPSPGLKSLKSEHTLNIEEDRNQWMNQISSIWGINVDFLDYPPIQFQNEQPSWQRIANENVFHSFLPKNKLILQHFIKKFGEEKFQKIQAPPMSSSKTKPKIQVYRPSAQPEPLKTPKSVNFIGKFVDDAIKHLDKQKTLKTKNKSEIFIKEFLLKAEGSRRAYIRKIKRVAEEEEKQEHVHHTYYQLNISLPTDHQIGEMFDIISRDPNRKSTEKKSRHKIGMPRHSNTSALLPYGNDQLPSPGQQSIIYQHTKNAQSTGGTAKDSSPNSAKKSFFQNRAGSGLANSPTKKDKSYEKSGFGRESSGLSCGDGKSESDQKIPSFSHLTNLSKEAKLPLFATNLGSQIQKQQKNSVSGRRSLMISTNQAQQTPPKQSEYEQDKKNVPKRSGLRAMTRRKSDCSSLSGGISAYEKKTLDVIIESDQNLASSPGLATSKSPNSFVHGKRNSFFFEVKNQGQGDAMLNIQIFQPGDQQDIDQISVKNQESSISIDEKNGLQTLARRSSKKDKLSDTSSVESLEDNQIPTKNSTSYTSLNKKKLLKKIKEVESGTNTPHPLELTNQVYKQSTLKTLKAKSYTPVNNESHSIPKHKQMLLKPVTNHKHTNQQHKSRTSSISGSVSYQSASKRDPKTPSLHYSKTPKHGTPRMKSPEIDVDSPLQKKQKIIMLPQLTQTRESINTLYMSSSPTNGKGYSKLNQLINPARISSRTDNSQPTKEQQQYPGSRMQSPISKIESGMSSRRKSNPVLITNGRQGGSPKKSSSPRKIGLLKKDQSVNQSSTQGSMTVGSPSSSKMMTTPKSLMSMKNGVFIHKKQNSKSSKDLNQIVKNQKAM